MDPGDSAFGLGACAICAKQTHVGHQMLGTQAQREELGAGLLTGETQVSME